MTILTYSEMMELDTYEDRLAYLSLDGVPTIETFDTLRYLNQRFYRSKAWRDIRKLVVARDLGFDLAVPGRKICGKVLVHHINPLKPKDLYYDTERGLDPDNLITVSNQTHLAIHYGSQPMIEDLFVERYKGDTKLW